MKPLPRRNRFRNRMEGDYAAMLAIRQAAGEIVGWRYEEMKFNIGERAWYMPDFFVIFEDHFEFHEIKGYRRQAGIVRFKSAAKQYPYFRWVLVTRKKGSWQYEEAT
jgi:hypothetical protein